MIRATLLCIIVMTASGCGQPSATEPQSESPSVSAPDTTAPDTVTPTDTGDGSASEPDSNADEQVALKIASFDELQSAIESSKGRIVVVDYWSTQCPPCMKEFPGLVALHRKYPSSQVRCISVSLDYENLPGFSVEDARDAAMEFLETQNATLENFILNEDSLVIMDEKLKIAAIPAVFVFGTDGKLARQFDESLGEPFTYEKHVTPFVTELVKQSFPADSPASTNE